MNYGLMYDTLNFEQKSVFNKLINGENVFITGNAGTGKSYLIKAYNEYCSLNGIKLVKTAPTGVAANEIGGATLHHQFKLKVGLDFKQPNKYPDFLDNTDVLLIDEISMVRVDIFDKLMQILTLANNARKGKKAIQLILCGDFFQLAPVISKDERPHLKDFYQCDIKDGYSFQSKYWNMYGVQLVNLTTVIRQSDYEFCNALDMCKKGDADCLKFISKQCSKKEIEDAIWLCGKNATAAQKNEDGLRKINGTLYSSQAKYEGNVTKADKLCDDVFNFKIGAKVVMLVNDSNGFYQNGTVGTITKISYRNDEDDDLWGIEGTEIDTISVTFSKNNTVEVKRQTFSKKEYVAEIKDVPKLDENGKPIVENGVPVMTSVKELKQKEIGSAEQFPMRLGYAVTIHKSQGQTYDSMNLAPEIFATGQLYVALSRCKSIQNIYVSGFLSKRMVMASNEVVEFYNNPNGYTFFNKEEEMKAVFIPKKYVSRVEKLIAEWSGAI